MWTVTLKLWPQVVTGHLLGGFATLSLLFLLTLAIVRRVAGANRASAFAVLGDGRVAAGDRQIALGGWVSSNYAAVACIDFPTCHGQWLPPADFANGFHLTQHIGPNYLGGQLDSDARTAIHLTHRIGALLVTLVLLGLRLATESRRHDAPGWPGADRPRGTNHPRHQQRAVSPAAAGGRRAQRRRRRAVADDGAGQLSRANQSGSGQAAIPCTLALQPA